MIHQKLSYLSADRDRTQYPYNAEPRTPEASMPKYSPAPMETVRINMRDGVHIELDICRPAGPGKFPALVGCSPYGKYIQHTPIDQVNNEAGDIDFWVRRGYVHVVYDVRGSGQSGGVLSFLGEPEQKDGAEVIEWVAQQPWCSGNVGMIGMSYFGVIQYLVAAQQPPSLKAIFPYDGWTDLYREYLNNGGLNVMGFDAAMTYFVARNNLAPGIPQDRLEALLEYCRIQMNQVYPNDGPYFWERSSYNKMDRIKVPVNAAAGWYSMGMHLRGAFTAWEKLRTPKRLFIAGKNVPARPWMSFHIEARRWYDHYLKGMDSGILEGPPVNIYTLGAEEWRGYSDWPLPGTKWTEMYLTSNGWGEGQLLYSRPDRTSEQKFTTDPESRERLLGLPALVYRTEPFDADTHIAGPLALYLLGAADQPDTHWIVKVLDEAAEGRTRVLSKGWLRGSHRGIDPARSKPYQPWHPHQEREPLIPNQPTEFPIEIWPFANVFKRGHRLRMEISACDSPGFDFAFGHYAYGRIVTNTVFEGGTNGSKLLVPMIPS